VILFSWSTFPLWIVLSHFIFTHQSEHWFCTLETVFKMKRFNLSSKPFRIRREVLKLLFTLLMSAFSLHFVHNNETLCFFRSWMFFYLIFKKLNVIFKNNTISVDYLRPVKFSVLQSKSWCVVTNDHYKKRLPGSLFSCIQFVTSLISLNNH